MWRFHEASKSKKDIVIHTFLSECNCNAVGSTSTECNSDGQCTCKPGFSGQKCNECDDLHFGFPSCDKNGRVALKTCISVSN